jgi:A/G-specific adenine glycosylase
MPEIRVAEAAVMAQDWRRVMKPRFEISVLEDRNGFRSALARWFVQHGKDYPWRRTRDPHAILISEVMLHQTQIATVLGKGYYQRFLRAFPDLRSLAEADDAALLKAWEGLGYYRRARMLRETARAVLENHGGVFPQDVDLLMKLPGIGRYTAGALRAFAWNIPAVLVDGNVARVLARLLDISDPVDDTAGIQRIWNHAATLADHARPQIYHAALMELGQVVCRPGVPDCLQCPVARFCRSDEPDRLPVKQRKIPITRVDEHALWMRDHQGRLLLHHEGGKRRTGLWKLPTREAAAISHLTVLAEHRYAITRYRVTLRVHDGSTLLPRFRPSGAESWQAPSGVPALAIAAPFRRVIEQLLENS